MQCKIACMQALAVCFHFGQPYASIRSFCVAYGVIRYGTIRYCRKFARSIRYVQALMSDNVLDAAQPLLNGHSTKNHLKTRVGTARARLTRWLEHPDTALQRSSWSVHWPSALPVVLSRSATISCSTISSILYGRRCPTTWCFLSGTTPRAASPGGRSRPGCWACTSLSLQRFSALL